MSGDTRRLRDTANRSFLNGRLCFLRPLGPLLTLCPSPSGGAPRTGAWGPRLHSSVALPMSRSLDVIVTRGELPPALAERVGRSTVLVGGRGHGRPLGGGTLGLEAWRSPMERRVRPGRQGLPADEGSPAGERVREARGSSGGMCHLSKKSTFVCELLDRGSRVPSRGALD